MSAHYVSVACGDFFAAAGQLAFAFFELWSSRSRSYDPLDLRANCLQILKVCLAAL